MKIVHHSFSNTFDLVKDGRVMRTLTFPKWFSFRATSRIPSGELAFVPTSFWKSRFRVEKNGKEVGHLRLSWRGEAQFELNKSGDPIMQAYSLKRRSLFKSIYELSDAKGLIATLRSRMNWKKWGAEVEIEFVRELESERLAELMLCAGYVLALLRARNSSG